jgi:hypothetical protein
MSVYACRVCVCEKNKKQKNKKQKTKKMRCVRVFFVLYAVSSYPTDFWVSIICDRM